MAKVYASLGILMAKVQTYDADVALSS